MAVAGIPIAVVVQGKLEVMFLIDGDGGIRNRGSSVGAVLIGC